jgi:glycogenin glucosyltransferase
MIKRDLLIFLFVMPRAKLTEVASIQEVNVMDSADTAHLALLARPELGITFTKLHCWTLTQYSKCVFLDADTLVCLSLNSIFIPYLCNCLLFYFFLQIIQNCDELFDREELSAAPDAGWPDCFNSGVFVFKPSLETYSNVIDFAVSQGSFDGILVTNNNRKWCIYFYFMPFDSRG